MSIASRTVLSARKTLWTSLKWEFYKLTLIPHPRFSFYCGFRQISTGAEDWMSNFFLNIKTPGDI